MTALLCRQWCSDDLLRPSPARQAGAFIICQFTVPYTQLLLPVIKSIHSPYIQRHPALLLLAKDLINPTILKASDNVGEILQAVLGMSLDELRDPLGYDLA